MTQQAQVQTVTENINESIARHYLGFNTLNRTASKSRIQHYAEQMAQGRWYETGTAIQFGQSGALLDGQHRLLAFIKAAESQPGLELPFQVARGVPDPSFTVLDEGKSRNGKDVLTIAGYTNAAMLSSVTVAYRCIVHQTWAGVLPDNDLTLTMVKEHPALGKSLTAVESVKNMFPRPAIWGGVVAHAIEQGVSVEAMNALSNSIRTGADLSAGSPALALRNWAILQRTKGLKVAQDEYAYVAYRTIHDYIHGKEIRRLGSTMTAESLLFDVKTLAPKPAKKSEQS